MTFEYNFLNKNICLESEVHGHLVKEVVAKTRLTLYLVRYCIFVQMKIMANLKVKSNIPDIHRVFFQGHKLSIYNAIKKSIMHYYTWSDAALV